ncbi:MAG: CoA-binding protein [Bdellovibrionota bacterium]
MRVAILGASDNPQRYAHMAFKMLQKYGHEPVPVTPKLKELEGVKAYSTLKEIPGTVDTLTMYVGPAISAKLQPEILALKPRRVIFNPGSENPELMGTLKKNGIQVLEACTLVLLRTNQFLSA